MLARGGRPPWHPPMVLARAAILLAALAVACLLLAGCRSGITGMPQARAATQAR
jgi:hypothetical protein